MHMWPLWTQRLSSVGSIVGAEGNSLIHEVLARLSAQQDSAFARPRSRSVHTNGNASEPTRKSSNMLSVATHDLAICR
jgi:hypothetical protein